MYKSAVEPPESAAAHVIADWLEITMMIEDRSEMSRSSLRRHLDGTADEADVELVLTEVRRREMNAPLLYPYRLESDLVHRRSDISLSAPYDYMVLASFPQAPFRVAKRFAQVERGLDMLALHALPALLSPAARALRFAWPADRSAPKRRPGKFHDAIVWLADELDLPSTGQEVNPNRRDGGVDIVAWRPFRDGRSAFPVLLAQTTIQKDYAPKALDIATRLWCSWIGFGLDPMTALVIPGVVPMASPKWNDMRHSVSFVLDRLRVCELLEGTSVGSDPQIAAMQSWIASQVSAMRL